MAEKHEKGDVATLPTSHPLLILPPALKRWYSPRRQGLCSHLAHRCWVWVNEEGGCPPPPLQPPNCRTPLGVTHWLAAAPRGFCKTFSDHKKMVHGDCAEATHVFGAMYLLREVQHI